MNSQQSQPTSQLVSQPLVSKPKKSVKKKTTFVLKDINVSEIDKKYHIVKGSNLELKETTIPTQVTKIDDLESSKSYFSPFINETQKHHITMIDSITHQSIRARCCFWCRHAFTTHPIGCPIRYVHSKQVDLHVSEITKEKYTTTHPVSLKTMELLKQQSIPSVHLVPKDYYKTDGCFCSFNCCLAFINDNVSNPFYSESKYLLTNMYLDIFKTPEKITPAPSWRLLKEYGGFMTIQEFRDSFLSYLFIDNDFPVEQLPKVMPIGHVFEEHIIF